MKRFFLLPMLVISTACRGPTEFEPAEGVLLSVVSGDEQTGPAFGQLPDPLVVRVTRENGRPIAQQIVNFVVVDGDGSVFAGVAQTNRDGLAQEWWTLGPPGSQRLEVRAVHPGSGDKLVFGQFTATAVGPPSPPTSLSIDPGIFSADELTTQTFQVLFTNANGAPVPGVPFVASADSGVGSVIPESGVTDETGAAPISWTLGGNSDTETGIESITIRTLDGSLSHTSTVRAMPFTAVQCLDFEHSGFWISAGGCQYDPRLAGSSFQPTFRVTQPDYTPIAGATVTFEVDPTCLGSCNNPGSVSVTSAVTDDDGEVSVTWTLGPNTGSNRLLVGYQFGTVGVWVTSR